MIDLHTHTVFSDGELIPFELVRRAEELGCRIIAITDHMDFSNMELIIPRLAKAAKKLNTRKGIRVIPGCELTHIPPEFMKEAVREARKLGAKIVVGHGETVVEPVIPGSNRAAIEAGVDILAHPGLISERDAALAAAKNVILEITARGGHNITNGHVVRTARTAKAVMTVNTDAHAPKDLIGLTFAKKIAAGAGLGEKEFAVMRGKVESWIKKRI